MKTLAVDSSAKACSAALVEDNKILGCFFVNTALTHSQTLLPMIDSVLKTTGINILDIDVFAVSVGPGSFTGVRIGVSAIKGIAMPLGKPCVAVSTLESMSYNISEDAYICAVMDARCSQVYNALFEKQGETRTRICEDRTISLDALKSELSEIKGKIILIGDGAELCYNSFKEELPNVELAPENLRYQNASSVAFASSGKKTLTATELMPSYLRLPQAERELKKRLENKK